VKVSFWIVSIGAIISSLAAAGINSVRDTTLIGIFTLGIILALVGGYLRKGELKAEADTLEEMGVLKPIDTLKNILSEIERAERTLKNGEDESSLKEAMNVIEGISMDLILPLMERKELLKEKWGPEKFARFSIEFAYGERYLNRAFSALIDDYVGEAVRSLEISKEHIGEALKVAES